MSINYKRKFERIKKFLHDKGSGLVPINDEAEYKDKFSGSALGNETKLFKAYEKAWDARKFEIDNYWKRTTYFWAFQITSFTGYLAVINSSNYKDNENSEILFCIIAIGYITALSWALINIGSKFWQRHWEKHIDLLEDEITGPLYKTVYTHKSIRTFSVSKINELISDFFVVIWVLLGIKYFREHLCIICNNDLAYIELTVLIFLIIFTYSMYNGYGRGNFKPTYFKFYSRQVFK
ncbi:hypothetical protein MUU74_10910 [Chryseobacterium daecheongense]|uniref:RipA family octameric membrane protein n=1 Tax=Chryseobacterium daecheongense TaxID=192389 RepID=UPI001FD71D21|nr:hypothetical protein [Chryseobacterium daecheongense]UOU97004.1 hypothetical protein MUU74_10910 [Chryseobacterium daecheongense]